MKGVAIDIFDVATVLGQLMGFPQSAPTTSLDKQQGLDPPTTEHSTYRVPSTSSCARFEKVDAFTL